MPAVELFKILNVDLITPIGNYNVLLQPESDLRTVVGSPIEPYLGALYLRAVYIKFRMERCFVIGNPVRVIRPSGERNALALDIDNACRLLVRYEDGSEEVLSSGEISIRLKERNANET